MQFPYALAAIDLDDTLLGPDHKISARNALAVRALASRGVTCVIASGRMHEATIRFADELGLDSPIISYNGSLVKHPRTAEVWRHIRVPAGPAALVVEYCADYGHHLNYYLDDHLYVAARTEWADFYLRQTGSPMEVIGDLRELAGSEPTKMILIDSPDVTDRLLGHFQRQFGESLYITKTNSEYLEFMNPAASKGAALELVANRLGIAREATIAFGDGNNDLPMIEWAGLGVAMGTAKPHVRAAADEIAPPYDEDGLGIYIEQLLAAPDNRQSTCRP
jgi:Cof subfamily protein (haloacid dehalogenase superfamily)